MNGELMAAEMAEQPAVLRHLVERRELVKAQVRSILPEPLAGITLVARGSSDNAAIYGRYILEIAARRPAGLTAPSIHTLYRAPVDMTGYLAIAISQSGETPEVATVLGRLRDQGARSLAIVNAGGSSLARAADLTVELDAGEEWAVPATKTLTATMACLAVVAGALGGVPWDDRDLAALPRHIAGLLAHPSCADRIAGELGDWDRILATGRGLLLVAALETALKIRETSGMFAEGISPADLQHGPIAAVTEGFPVLAFRPAQASAADVDEVTPALLRRGARLLVVGPGTAPDCPLPAGVPDALLPILAVVRGQQVAAAIARRRHLDPDHPAGLSKVTPTR